MSFGKQNLQSTKRICKIKLTVQITTEFVDNHDHWTVKSNNKKGHFEDNCQKISVIATLDSALLIPVVLIACKSVITV